MKVLVTGAGGQLGHEVRRCFETMSAEIGPIPAEYADAEALYADSSALDITDADAVSAIIASYAPDIVINCAAYTNVDGCETDEDAAFAVNAEGPRNLARACQATGAKLVHVSTDYVFPGDEPGERVEGDPCAPASAYGRSKLAGERAVAEECEQHFIVRTAWLYGYVGRNFVKTMRSLGQRLDEVTVVDDQLGNPTSANDVAYELLTLALTDGYGIYHCTNNGTTSWATFAAAIMAGFGLDCKVVPVSTEQYRRANPASAPRPAFSSLCNANLAQTMGDDMRDWESALATYIANLPELEG